MPQTNKKQKVDYTEASMTLNMNDDAESSTIEQDPTTVDTSFVQDPTTTTNITVESVELTSDDILENGEAAKFLSPSGACKKCSKHIKDKKNLKRKLDRLQKKVDVIMNLNEQASVNVRGKYFAMHSYYCILFLNLLSKISINYDVHFRNMILKMMFLTSQPVKVIQISDVEMNLKVTLTVIVKQMKIRILILPIMTLNGHVN